MYEYSRSKNSIDVRFSVIDVEPVEYIMLGFHSTYMFNFATWESMYSVFPFSTLRCDHMGVLFLLTPAECKLFIAEVHGQRRIGDEWTYRVMFSGTSVDCKPELGFPPFYVTEDGLRFV